MNTISTLPALLQAFFMDRLMQQRQASPHTVSSYRDTFRLLLQYAQKRLGKAPSNLTVPELDTPLLGAFLEHLERERKNSARSRNVRLAAIHCFFRYVALHAPEHSAAELTSLRCEDIVLGSGAHVRCQGKGRKSRCTPLRKDTVLVLRSWLRERHGQPDEPVFPTTRGTALSHDALQYMLDKHLPAARRQCPSLTRKRVTPHVLRHTLAMDLLHHGADQTVIALWLGHESPQTTSIYLHADMQLKERALATTTAKNVSIPRYRPSDRVMDFLKGL